MTTNLNSDKTPSTTKRPVVIANDADETSAPKKPRGIAAPVMPPPARICIPFRDIPDIDSDAVFDSIMRDSEADRNLVVVVFLYATWSTPCKGILKTYQSLLSDLAAAQHSDDGAGSGNNTETTEEAAVDGEANQDTPTVVTLRFYKIDKDRGPRRATKAKVPVFVVYRAGKTVGEISTRGRALEKFVSKLAQAPKNIQKIVMLTSCPTEILEAIAVYLPVDPLLMHVGLASKAGFAPLVLGSPEFAQRHLRFKYAAIGLSLWEFLALTDVRARWPRLPKTYRLAVCIEMLRAYAIASPPPQHRLLHAQTWNLSAAFAIELVETLAVTDDALTPASWPFAFALLAPQTHCAQALRALLCVAAERGFAPPLDSNFALRFATEHRLADVVFALLEIPEVDPSVNDSAVLQMAAAVGHARLVEKLLEDSRVNAAALNGEALKLAARGGHTDVMRILLWQESVDPSEDDNAALQMASLNGHTEAVYLLLADPRVNPAADRNACLHLAISKGFLDIVEALVCDRRFDLSFGFEETLGFAIRRNNPLIINFLKEKYREKIDVNRAQ
ncbi:hypothetical protein HDU84_008365 [Entophlyctis sp. JEL0112]|nr:hypothetical protein HDU84_008365 [Entophlyctis sp. JEL0112]